MKKITKRQIKNIIDLWVYTNYGQSELRDPSWCIEDLADILALKINKKLASEK